MSDPHAFDVAIVGAGIAGASLAWQLAPHLRVLLLERESQPGMHSTGRSAAMFMESYGTPQVRALTRASRRFYEQPPPGFTEQPILAPRGVLYAAWAGQQAQLDALEAELGALCTRLSVDQAMARVPALRREGLIGALAEPDAMDIDVDALHQGYLRGMRKDGGTLRCDTELLSAMHDGHDWTLTLRGSMPVRCRSLINAAGAWADAVAQCAGVAALGLQPRRRSAFTFSAPGYGDACRGWPAVLSVGEGWYFKPDAGALLGSPANADPVPAHDVQPEELDIAQGIDAIQRHTTLTIRRPQRSWAGLRTFAPDGDLVIGWDDAAPRFFWLAGQGGYGIQSAAGASLLAAALCHGRPLPQSLLDHGVDAARMAPLRLRTRGLTRAAPPN